MRAVAAPYLCGKFNDLGRSQETFGKREREAKRAKKKKEKELKKQEAKANKKRKKLSMAEAEADFIANCPPGREGYYKLFAAKEKAKAEKKRVHSKAYHAALTLARREGKGIEEAKVLARKAGADAALAWTGAQGE